MKQRICLLVKALRGAQIFNMYGQSESQRKTKWNANIYLNLRRFLKQRETFAESILNTVQICTTVAKERADHIQAIEISRNKKFYDVDHKFIDSIIEKQGREEHDQFLYVMKKDKLGTANVKPLETELLERQPKHLKLQR